MLCYIALLITIVPLLLLPTITALQGSMMEIPVLAFKPTRNQGSVFKNYKVSDGWYSIVVLHHGPL